jgi:hypothetical protein
MPLIIQTDVRYVKLFAMDSGLNFEAFCIRSHSSRPGLNTRVPGSFGAFLRRRTGARDSAWRGPLSARICSPRLSPADQMLIG